MSHFTCVIKTNSIINNTNSVIVIVIVSMVIFLPYSGLHHSCARRQG